MSTSDPVTSSVEALASVSLSTQAAPPAEKAKPLPPGQRKVHEAAQAEANAAAKKAAGKTTKSSKKKAANPDFVAIFNERFSNVQGEYIDTHCHIDYILDRFNTEKVPFPASSTVASTASEGATAAGDASSTTAANTAAFADTCCAPKTSCVSSTSSAEGKEGESKSKPLVPGPWSWSTLTSELILGNCPALVTVCCDADTHDRILELIDTAHKAAEAQATEAQSAVLSSSSEAKQPEQQQKQQRRPAPVLVGAFGLHPHNAKEWNEAIQAKLEQAMSHPRVVAWGECGLDYYYENSPRDVQKKVFAIQMGLAVKHGKPLVVHSRDAEEDTLELMMKHLPQDWKIHLHWYVSFISVDVCILNRRKVVVPPFPVPPFTSSHASCTSIPPIPDLSTAAQALASL